MTISPMGVCSCDDGMRLSLAAAAPRPPHQPPPKLMSYYVTSGVHAMGMKTDPPHTSTPLSTTTSSNAPPSYNADAASLRAALSIIEDWDSEFNALFDLESSSSPPPAHSTSRPGPSNSRPAAASKKLGRPKTTTDSNAPYAAATQRRDARKQEIQELRAQVEQLQRIVDQEKAAQYTTNPDSRTSIDPKLAGALRDAWEKMAESQKCERFAAQVENAKLRKVVDTQLKNADKIAKLTQRVAALEQALPPLLPPVSFEAYEGPVIEPAKHLLRLETLRLEATEVFASHGFLKHGRASFREVQFRNEMPSSDGLQADFEMTWLLPFAVDKVSDALWIQATRMAPRDRIIEFKDLHEEGDQVVSQFISNPTNNDSFGSSHGQLAARRLRSLDHENQAKVLIVSSIESRAFDLAKTKWMAHARGTSWLQIERVDDGTAASSRPLSRVKWCRRVRIRPHEAETMTPAQLSLWVHNVVTGPMRARVERNLEWSLQMIENFLLDDPKAV